MTAAEQRAEDKERLEDVTHVLHGEHGTGAVQRVLYAVYLLGLLAFTYGFTVARALFITSDPAWLHDRLLGPGAAVVAVLLAVALTVLVHGLGRRRGPGSTTSSPAPSTGPPPCASGGSSRRPCSSPA
jgi:hypothetical protein